MEENQKPPNERPYDLEGRTFLFAKETRSFVKRLSRTVENLEDIKQLVRSSGSVGANYIEANESVKTSRREAKESGYWLRLLDCGENAKAEASRVQLVNEARELMNILAAILRKSE